jgi:hypothetical protein
VVIAWPQLSDNVRDYIQRIVEDFFRRQEIMQEMQPGWNPFGDACDRESWCKVRAMWQYML